MHGSQRPNRARSRERWQLALAVAAAVIAAHALVLHFSTRSPSAPAVRAPALTVRQLAVAAPQPAVATALPRTAPSPPIAPVPRRTERAHTRSVPSELRPPVESPRAPSPATQDDRAPRPTRVPPPAELVFALQRGDHVGQARLTWRADGERYALALHATLPSGRELEQHSEGGFDAAGLAPLRLADRRRGRDVRAANFQREHGKVTFSGPRWELPLEAGTQDRLSWLMQLVALIGGASDGLRDGTELAMWVVGARGAASHWRFEVRGQQAVVMGNGEAAAAWWLVREPAHPYDQRVEVWLGTQQGHWPLKLRQTQVPGGEPLEWLLHRHATFEPGT